MIIVTGGAGFIGSNIVKTLNKQGYTDILIVDNLTNKKYINVADLKISDYMDKKDFINTLNSSTNKIKNIDSIFHEGACSSTTIKNGKYIIKNNYQYSKHVLNFSLKNKIPFLYASSAAVYGNKKKILSKIKNMKTL